MFSTQEEMRQITGYLHPKSMRVLLFIITVFILLPATNAWACTCSSSPVFDYFAYNSAVLVLELEVMEKLPEPVQEPSLPSQSEILSPPKPPLPPRDYEIFRIKPLQVFKGDIGDIDLLRTLNRNSSCYWAPQPGDRFLLYVEWLGTNDGESFLVFTDACQRHRYPEFQYYQAEIAALQQLQQTKNGSFVIEDPSENNRPLLEGRFRNGKPSGKWKVYDLYDPLNSEPLVKFRMRSGSSSNLQWTKKTLSPLSKRYVLSWKYQYLW